MASKSVLELAVGTGQWDAGLKKAKQALDNFTQANGGLQSALNKDSKSMQTFVQMMGRMDSTAKTAKGQMNDYKGTIEQLTMQYNRLTDAQKQTIGQDYLRSIDQMKQKYQGVAEEVQKINQSLKTMPEPAAMSGGGLFGGGKMSGMLQVFGGNVMTKIAGAGLNFASELGDMVKQGIELAKQGEGIRIAFERLGRGDILDGLRQATHGTVSDIELMKAAVKFNDFRLPLEELGTMLAFAQQKAKDTGQSVDYMVDSIVTGLGRKSLMILDNLGLSAAQIKEKMAETGDMTKAVGAIIREEMAKAGDYVETAADRATKANVSLQNKMEELGRKFAPVEEASNQLWTSMKIAIMDIVSGPLAKMLNQLTEAGRLKNMLDKMNGNSDEGNTKVDNQLKKLQAIKSAGGSDYIFNATLSGMVEDYNRQINDLDAQIKNGGKPIGGGSGSSQDVRYLQRQMDALTVMRNQLQAGAKDITAPTPTTTTPVPVVIEPGGGNEPDWSKILAFNPSEIEKAGIADNFQSLFGNEEFMTIQRKLMGMDGEMTRDWGKEIGKVFADYIDDPDKAKRGKKDKETDKTIVGEMSKLTSGVSGIFSGIEQMGIELPEELKGIMNGIQGVMTILTSINTILGVIEGMQTVGLIPFFARGGMVPHAASGTLIPGNSFSGDNVFAGHAWVNSGELVLNRAQQNTLAGMLDNNRQPSGSGNGVARVSGEQIYIAVNNYLRRSGKGELVTWR